MEEVKPTLIILSDLWGARKSFPFLIFSHLIQERYNIRYYDSAALAEIPPDVQTQNELHQAFVNGGIEKAVANLCRQEPDIQHFLGLSVGGVIAWRYALLQPCVQKLITVSATRLRYETEKPASAIQLYYGAHDPFQPKAEWYKRLKLSASVVADADHELYRDVEWLNECIR